MKKIIQIVLLIIIINPLFSNTIQIDNNTYRSGIPSNYLNYIAVSNNNWVKPVYVEWTTGQWRDQWCWAASIQMIFKHYGINYTQEQIVFQTYGIDSYGQLPNQPASNNTISANLNGILTDNNHKRYSITSSMHQGAPDPLTLINTLHDNQPVLIAYQSSPTTGHAVVITGVTYRIEQNIWGQNIPVITEIAVRDPWRDNVNIQNLGRKIYPGIDLASKIMCHWYITITQINY